MPISIRKFCSKILKNGKKLPEDKLPAEVKAVVEPTPVLSVATRPLQAPPKPPRKNRQAVNRKRSKVQRAKSKRSLANNNFADRDSMARKSILRKSIRKPAPKFRPKSNSYTYNYQTRSRVLVNKLTEMKQASKLDDNIYVCKSVKAVRLFFVSRTESYNLDDSVYV